MTEEYVIDRAKVPHWFGATPAYKIACHVNGENAWHEELSLDDVKMAVLDVGEKLDRLQGMPTAVEARRAVMVSELYYQSFCGPNSLTPRRYGPNRSKIRDMIDVIHDLAYENLGEEALEETRSQAIQKYLAYIRPVSPS